MLYGKLARMKQLESALMHFMVRGSHSEGTRSIRVTIVRHASLDMGTHTILLALYASINFLLRPREL